MAVRGSARCTGSSGLGDTAAFIPAGGGTVREANSASRAARCPRSARTMYGACAALFPQRLFGRKSTPLSAAECGSYHGT